MSLAFREDLLPPLPAPIKYILERVPAWRVDSGKAGWDLYPASEYGTRTPQVILPDGPEDPTDGALADWVKGYLRYEVGLVPGDREVIVPHTFRLRRVHVRLYYVICTGVKAAAR